MDLAIFGDFFVFVAFLWVLVVILCFVSFCGFRGLYFGCLVALFTGWCFGVLGLFCVG